MQVDTLRFLDRFFGIPLCGICTFIRRMAGLGRRNRSLPTPRKVLIIKLSEMGSTVLAYPALAELKKRRPDVEPFVLVFKQNAAIFEVLDLARSANIITVEHGSAGRLLVSGFQAMRRLLSERIDTAIDMDFFSRLTALISFIVCRGNRVGHHRYTNEGLYRGNLLTHRVMYSPQVHTSVAFMALIRTLFEDPNDEPHYRRRIDAKDLIPARYTPSPEHVQSAWSKLAAAGLADKANQSIVLINPNSSDIFPLRKWPLDYFAQLCERLLKELPAAALVITGVASEQKDARCIQERVADPRCIDFTGKTNFRELLALYSIAKVMVTNDSGPAHFASLLELPTLVLFGPETPRLYGPMGDRHKDIYADFACSPCVSVYNGKKSPCRENRCLQTITVDQVLREVLAHMDAPATQNIR
ncbi:MAG TPA: glycosyltransferase family 9 protein [Candidatus Binatia bacterium]|jgi:ADP-heptose:LPS heptosyltransferase